MKITKGFTLIEIMIALAITGVVTGLALNSYIEDKMVSQGKTTGQIIAQYNSAVAARLADLNADAAAWAAEPVTQTGVDWLKGAAECGGSATSTKNYLPCNFSDQLPFGLSFSTTKISGPEKSFSSNFGRVLVGGVVKIGIAKVIRNTAIQKGTVGPEAISAVNKTYDVDFAIGGTEGTLTALAEVAPGTASMWVRTDGSSEITGPLKGNGTLTLSADQANTTSLTLDSSTGEISTTDSNAASGYAKIRTDDVWIDAINDWASNISTIQSDNIKGAFYVAATGKIWDGSVQTSGWVNCDAGSQTGEQIKISSQVVSNTLQTRIEANYAPKILVDNFVWSWVENVPLRNCSELSNNKFQPHFLDEPLSGSYSKKGIGKKKIDQGPYQANGNSGSNMDYGAPSVADPAWATCDVYLDETYVNHPTGSYDPITYFDSGWVSGIASISPNTGKTVSFNGATTATGTLSSGTCSAVITTIQGK